MNGKYFCDDWSHPSELGHQYIADQLLRLVSTNKVRCRQDGQEGEWVGEKDCCVSWLKGGGKEIISNHSSSNIVGIENLEHVEFDNWTKKYAAEVAPTGGSIKVKVDIIQSDTFVCHMQVGPEKDQYPRTRAWLVFDNGTSSPPVKLDTFYEYTGHVTSVAYIGPGPSQKGNVTIYFQPLQEGMAHPFRIIGTIVTPHNNEYFQPLQEGMARPLSNTATIVAPHDN
jgi:hypothetical protein